MPANEDGLGREGEVVACGYPHGTDLRGAAIDSYITWGTNAVGTLTPWLPSEDVDALIRTPTHWSALTMPRHTALGHRLVSDEMLGRRQELQRVVASIEQFYRRFSESPSERILVPDTNVLLEHPQSLSELDWRQALGNEAPPVVPLRVIVPLMVVDELDDLKRVNRTWKRARETLKDLYGRFGSSIYGEASRRRRRARASAIGPPHGIACAFAPTACRRRTNTGSRPT